MDDIECGGFIFTSNFDSGNLAHVELVLPKTDLPGLRPDKHEPPDYEFNVWTRPDCMGSEFENGNRTWFYFGIRMTEKEIAARKNRPCKKGSFKYTPASTLVPISEPSAFIKFNLVNMNKQAKLYAQGMAPVVRVLPSKPSWERIRDRPATMNINGNFAISFKYRMVDDPNSTTYFAFTYPYTYEELQHMLQSFDDKFGILSPYSYRSSSKYSDKEKHVPCDIDKKKPLIIKLNNSFKSKRKSFLSRRSTDTTQKNQASIEKISLPDVCVQEVFKNCINLEQESDHLLSNIKMEQSLSGMPALNISLSNVKTITPTVLKDVSKPSDSKDLKTILPPTYSRGKVSKANSVASATPGPIDTTRSNLDKDVKHLQTLSSPIIESKTSAASNKDIESSGNIKSGELSLEMAVHVARHPDDIYYYRELLTTSLQGRRIDLLTITSYRNISIAREHRLEHLFPLTDMQRPHKFSNKKIIFLSARVHPGETPSSFVLNGFIHLLLDRSDPVAATLRKLYVFKIIPFLNPDGVVLGHYRTDSRGCNLNRVYNAPSKEFHPSVYAARALIRYYHKDYMQNSENCSQVSSLVKAISLECKNDSSKLISRKTLKTDYDGLSEVCKSEDEIDKKRSDPLTPLKRLQDTLRASIDLMSRRVDLSEKITNSSSNEGDSRSGSPPVPTTPMKQRTPLWCDVCLNGLYKLESNIPGISNIVPTAMTDFSNTKFEKNDPSNPIPDVTHAIASSPNTTTDPKDMKTPDNSLLGVINSCKSKSFAFDDKICRNCRIRPIMHRPLDTAPKPATSSGASSAGDNPVDMWATPSSPTKPGKSCVPLSSERGTSASVTKRPATGSTTWDPDYDTEDESEIEAPFFDQNNSALFLYIDMHGHASKRGIFMYGNHIRYKPQPGVSGGSAPLPLTTTGNSDTGSPPNSSRTTTSEAIDPNVTVHELPKLMAVNSLHFHYSACNFTERNMYVKDRRDGSSRAGSGRVSIWKQTGLLRSYTLECNYNTGRMVNTLAPTRHQPDKRLKGGGVPPKYTPKVFEEVGRALGPSILDLTDTNPRSRLCNSEYRNMNGVRESLYRDLALADKAPPSAKTSARRHKNKAKRLGKDPAGVQQSSTNKHNSCTLYSAASQPSCSRDLAEALAPIAADLPKKSISEKPVQRSLLVRKMGVRTRRAIKPNGAGGNGAAARLKKSVNKLKSSCPLEIEIRQKPSESSLLAVASSTSNASCSSSSAGVKDCPPPQAVHHHHRISKKSSASRVKRSAGSFGDAGGGVVVPGKNKAGVLRRIRDMRRAKRKPASLEDIFAVAGTSSSAAGGQHTSDSRVHRPMRDGKFAARARGSNRRLAMRGSTADKRKKRKRN